MHPQQVVKVRKYHHEQCTEEVCGEDEEESKDGEGEVCVGLRWCVLGWCCMCIFWVGEEDGDGDECGGEGE